MSVPEQMPLWERMTHPLAKVLEIAFGCHHRKLSRVFTEHGHSYKVCCECGATFRYSLDSMSITHRRKLFPMLRRLRVEGRRRRLLRKNWKVLESESSGPAQALRFLILTTIIPARCGACRRRCAGRSPPKLVSRR